MAEVSLVDIPHENKKSRSTYGSLNSGDIFRFAHDSGAAESKWCIKGDEKAIDGRVWYTILRSGVMGTAPTGYLVALPPKDKAIQIIP